MILTSILLVLVLSTTALANDVLAGQVENAEFDVARDVMLALNNMVKEVMYKPTSSRYVKTAFQTTSPHLLDTEDSISLWIQIDGEPVEYLIQDCPISIIKIQGGVKVKESEKDLVGTSSVQLEDFSSLGHLHVQRSNRVELILDFARIRCIYTGTLNLTQEYNIIEVVFINMTTGLLQLNDRAVFIVNSLETTISQHFYQGTLTIGVNDTRGHSESILYSDLPNDSTLINLMVVDIEISLIGGV